MAASIMITADFLGLPRWVNPSFSRTAVGEQRAIALEDGSLVQLNTATQLVVQFTPWFRGVSLDSGEARFTVSHGVHRPFIVTTPQASVRAVGTIFNVRTAASGTDVAVLQGHVVVDAAGRSQGSAAPERVAALERSGPGVASGSARALPQRLDLYVGQRAAISPGGHITLGAGPSLGRVEGWTEGRLVFRNETLADLVAEFNRYHVHPLRIADPGLAGLRVSGTFAANDLASLEQFLERFEGVDVRTEPDGTQLLLRADHR